MKGFTFIGVFVVSLVIATFVSFIAGSIPGDSDDESDFAFRWLTACIFFAAYIAWNMVAKNG